MSDGIERSGNLPPEVALQRKLEEQGLFVLVDQSVRESGGGYDYVYAAVVLGETEVAEAITKANTYEGQHVEDAAGLRWGDVKDRPEVYEGEDRLDALKGAMGLFFG